MVYSNVVCDVGYLDMMFGWPSSLGESEGLFVSIPVLSFVLDCCFLVSHWEPGWCPDVHKLCAAWLPPCDYPVCTDW